MVRWDLLNEQVKEVELCSICPRAEQSRGDRYYTIPQRLSGVGHHLTIEVLYRSNRELSTPGLDWSFTASAYAYACTRAH